MFEDIESFLRTISLHPSKIIAALEENLADTEMWEGYFRQLQEHGQASWPVGSLLHLCHQFSQESSQLLPAALAATKRLPPHLGQRWLDLLDEVQDQHERLLKAVRLAQENQKSVSADLVNEHTELALRARRELAGLEVEAGKTPASPPLDREAVVAPSDVIRELAPARHSSDFRSVHWYGIDYTFTAGQAACVSVLWKDWQNGTPDVSQEHVLGNAGAESRRLADLFSDHLAWQTMIVAGSTKGAYRLQEPCVR